MNLRAPLAVLAFLASTACGGGGATAPAPAPLPAPTPPPAPTDLTPVAAADPGSALPEGWQHGAFAQIFVRSYRDSDGDGRGDLRGLIERLDYLQALGVKGLWLLPVTQSQDADHGYAVTDYRAIEAAYGSLADLDELLKQAHARGIGVILDYVLNHGAARHPLFANARDSRTNPYRDWFVWQDPPPGGWSIYGGNPWHATGNGAYYAPFWDQMPDFNLARAEVVDWHRSNLRFWLNRGVDGFRFDAVGNLFESGPAAWENQPRNYALMTEIRGLLDGYARRHMVCEAPADPRGFATACGSAFAFDLRGTLVDAARGGAGTEAAVGRLADYFKTAPVGLAPLISNHDSFAGQRLADQLAGHGTGADATARYKLAAASYLLLPGTPFIYYGEEIGMSGAADLAGDAKLRTPMSWTASTANAGFTAGTPYRALAANVATHNVAAQQADPGSILAFYKALLKLRNDMPALSRGIYEHASAGGALLQYQRRLAGQRALVLINYGDAMAMAAVGGLPVAARLTNAHPTGGADAQADGAGQASIVVPARSLRVFNVL